jgi:hypothetical protein
MERLTPQEKIWISRLESSNPADIMIAIKEISNHGNIKMLPYLFNLLQPHTHEAIRKSILLLVSEIKTQAAASVIVDALEHCRLGDDFTAVVAACWQSGLDFSAHIPSFIRIFIEGDYQTAVEAFSVIEEAIFNADPGIKEKSIRLLRNSEKKINQEKQPLFVELKKVISIT